MDMDTPIPYTSNQGRLLSLQRIEELRGRPLPENIVKIIDAIIAMHKLYFRSHGQEMQTDTEAGLREQIKYWLPALPGKTTPAHIASVAQEWIGRYSYEPEVSRVSSMVRDLISSEAEYGSHQIRANKQSHSCEYCLVVSERLRSWMSEIMDPSGLSMSGMPIMLSLGYLADRMMTERERELLASRPSMRELDCFRAMIRELFSSTPVQHRALRWAFLRGNPYCELDDI